MANNNRTTESQARNASTPAARAQAQQGQPARGQQNQAQQGQPARGQQNQAQARDNAAGRPARRPAPAN